ncbi:MAG: DUF4091 domain-containing protein, partial [Kiritimatiellia bacterium]|nr:DUF4091 domain-containing protein [Kiritimatiellia bacterium]
VLERIEIAPMKTVDNTRSVAEVDYRGEVFDVIQDGSDLYTLPQDLPLCVFVRVHAEASVQAGLYRGGLTLTAEGYSRTVPVEVRVYGFELPERSALKVAFSFFENFYINWYRLTGWTDEQRLSIYRFLMSYRITPNNIYSREIFPVPELLAELPGANFATLGYFASKTPLSDADLDGISKEVGEKLARLKSVGFPDEDIYLYGYDEFGVQSVYDRNSARVFSERMFKDYPGIKLMQTSMPMPPFDEYFNVWVPPIQTFEQMKPQYRKAGNELWWYWVSPPKPFPNFDLGHAAFDSRMALLLGFKYGIEGCLYWSLNREWNENRQHADAWVSGEKDWEARYLNSFTGKPVSQCGQGNLTYPGPAGRIWPSIRLENVRDGIEDFNTLALLRTLAMEIRSGRRPQGGADLEQIDALLAMPGDVVESLWNWTKDPSVLAAYRDRVAQQIEQVLRAERKRDEPPE